jgi:hypothetical protein
LTTGAGWTVPASTFESDAVFALGPVCDCWTADGVVFEFAKSLAAVGCGNAETTSLVGDFPPRKKLEITAKTITRASENITFGAPSLSRSSDWQTSQNFRLASSGHSSRSIFSPQLQQKFGR